jgi:hypothetical protein
VHANLQGEAILLCSAFSAHFSSDTDADACTPNLSTTDLQNNFIAGAVARTSRFRWGACASSHFDLIKELWLRPYLGLGLEHSDDTICGPGMRGELCVSPGSSNAKACTLGGLLRYTMGIFSVSGDVRRLSVVEGWKLFDSAAWTSAWIFGVEAGVVF